MTTRKNYYAVIQTGFSNEKGHFQEAYQKGLEQVRSGTSLFGYLPPRWMLDFASAGSFLYAQNGKAELAQQVYHALTFYRAWLKTLPAGVEQQRPEYAEGVPPMDTTFYPLVFVPAVQNIRNTLSSVELEALVEILADSLRPIWLFPEWGGHNRAMLRAAGLAVSASAFPEHAEAGQWENMADELAEESWGRWSVEDAMMYQAHWLRALFLYAEARGRLKALKEMIQPRHYLRAMTQMISPLGMLPDFGDSHWLSHSAWEWIACLEWGAKTYQDHAMKWTASQLLAKRQKDPHDLYTASAAILAWKWCDDRVPALQPSDEQDALDELVLKKVVWRTGWGNQAAYACLNYQDEGHFGRIARDYLRGTLAVSAEKMHHGHADEGSLVMLVHDGTLLLHESGYRENPPDGIYRSAAYHNRVVWQPGRQSNGMNLIEFLRGDGRYRQVQTERLYGTHLHDADYTRIRITDASQGLVWDRSIIFIPKLPAWIIVDGVLSLRDEARTLAQLWWTTDILTKGPDWFETHLVGVQDWQNARSSALLIHLPQTPGPDSQISIEPFRRSFQPEVALARSWQGLHRTGQMVNFVSVLWPHPYNDLDERRAAAVEVFESSPAGRGIGVRIKWQDEERWYGVLNNLSAGFGEEDVRPKYTAAQGLTAYGPLMTDAAFAFARPDETGCMAGFINGTSLSWADRVGYEGLPMGMFQEDRSMQPGIPARFRWEGRVA